MARENGSKTKAAKEGNAREEASMEGKGRETEPVERGSEETMKAEGAPAENAPAGGQHPEYDVRFSSFPNEGSIKGICSVTMYGEFAVKGIKLVEGSKGLFVAMPSYKSGEEYWDICFPVTKEARQKLQDAVISEYRLQMSIHGDDQHFGQGGADMAAPGGVPMNAMA